MSKLPLIARILLGLIFFVFGLNGFFMFLPMPPMPEAAGVYMGGLASSGFFFPVLKATEVICGLLLLSGAFVPLALVVPAPIVLQIFLFHAFLAPENGGLVMPLIIGALEIYLAFFSPYSAKIRALFRK